MTPIRALVAIIEIGGLNNYFLLLLSAGDN